MPKGFKGYENVNSLGETREEERHRKEMEERKRQVEEDVRKSREDGQSTN
jgi:hypothetical protein